MKRNPPVRLAPGSRRRTAFTLMELLVVIAIIGILASLLLVTLAKSKGRAQATFCMNNHRQLGLAWQMYAQENKDRLVNNYGRIEMRLEYQQKRFQNWVNGVMDWTRNEENTNLACISTGLLTAHASGATKIYKCPADNYLSPLQRKAGWSARTRSVSMNGYLGTFVRDGINLTVLGRNPFVPEYRQFLKLPDILNPAQIFVFLDEHADSIDDGIFMVDPGLGLADLDLPGSYHNGACDFTYADGHCGLHQWRSRQTVISVGYQSQRRWHPADPAGEEEHKWLSDHAAVPVSDQ